MTSTNPALLSDPFSNVPRTLDESETMTINGTVAKTGILLLCVLATAGWTWLQYFKTGMTSTINILMWVGIIGGLIAALVTVFKKEWAPLTAPIYALLEGFVIGGLSAVLESAYPGIAMQAAGLTFATLFTLLFAYSAGLVKATENFKLGVIAATGGIAIVYLVTIVLSFFHIQVPFIYGNGLFSIGFSVFVCIIAALNLVIDFDMIEQGARRGAPKYMEWYGAFALMVTLIWLYIETLRLLSKIKSRN
jgi:uncharacterized YccA/Bax inhibitor family protein